MCLLYCIIHNNYILLANQLGVITMITQYILTPQTTPHDRVLPIVDGQLLSTLLLLLK